MKSKDLKVGDRIRITKWTVPLGYGSLPKETVRVWKKIVLRGRSVRIFEIDKYGLPWYCCKFQRKNGTWEIHYLSIMDIDANWVLVKKRVK